jgi:hypothetical protein
MRLARSNTAARTIAGGIGIKKLGEIADVEKPACKFAKEHGWLCFKWTSPGQRGPNDRLFFRNSELLMIEFKDKGKRATKLQKHRHQQLAKQGFEVHVIDNLEYAKELLA